MVYVIGKKHVMDSMIFGYIYQDYQLVENAESVVPKKGDIIITSVGLCDDIKGFKKTEDSYKTIDVWIGI